MEQIYLVTTGSYSDYGVIAAFSTLRKAQEFAEHLPDHEAQTLELPVDEFDPGRTELYYTRVLMERDGNLHTEPQTYIMAPVPHPYTVQPQFDFRSDAWISPDRYPFVLRTTSHTKDKKAAVKRANEWRTQLESQDLWPKQPQPPRPPAHRLGARELIDANRNLMQLLEDSPETIRPEPADKGNTQASPPTRPKPRSTP